MKYKLKKIYPGLPKEAELGTIVELAWGRYQTSGLMVSLPKEDVENFPEYWEKISSLFTTEDDVDVNQEETRELSVVHLKHWTITSGHQLTPGHGYMALGTIDNYKFFKSSDRAKEYILHNKPVLSLADVVKCTTFIVQAGVYLVGNDSYHKLDIDKLEEKAKSKV